VRKLRELLYAVEMEQPWAKARILRLYLDNAPWLVPSCAVRRPQRSTTSTNAPTTSGAPEAVWLAAMLHNPALEAKRWASSGHINVARAQWVSGEIAVFARRQRAAMLKGLEEGDWVAPNGPLTKP